MPAGSKPIVHLDDVAKRYGDKIAVRALNLRIPAGTCFGLLGPNGAGKTTTLRMIYGAARPSRGSISVLGEDVARRPREVRSRLGVTLQENVLVDSLGAADNLRIFGRYHCIREPDLSRRVEEVMELLELRTQGALPVTALSGGYKRRLAIGMALMNRPELLILDEPTTGLDPAVRLALWRQIRALRASGTSVLLTTHYMDEAERLCDRLAIMAHGEIVAEGSPRGLISEHLAAEALELEAPEEFQEALLQGLSTPELQLRSGDHLVFYGEDMAGLAGQVRDRSRGREFALRVRPTNLEDVFLRLTGTSLDE